MDIPVDLKNAIETGECVLFVGAGMGYNMVDEDGNQIPDSKELAQMIAEKFSVPKLEEYSLIDLDIHITIPILIV